MKWSSFLDVFDNLQIAIICGTLLMGVIVVSCTRFRRHRVRCFMEQEVRHGEKAVYAGVQA
jgi:hypothetical protein